MSGVPPVKGKGKARPIPTSGILKPEDVALKPKPSLAKRPVKGVAGGPSINPLPAKKSKLDFGTGIGSSSATTSTNVSAAVPTLATGAAAPTATRPPLDTSWREFCQNTTIDVSNFAETITTAIAQEKSNKVARLISAAIRLFLDKKADSNRFTMEYQLITEICLALKEHGGKFTNPYLQKCLVNLLCIMRPFSAERQDIFISLNVCLAERLSNLDICYVNSYLFDSLGDRQWVDKASCLPLIGLILKPYGTIFPPREMYAACNTELVEPECVPHQDVPMKFIGESVTQEVLMSLVLDYLRKWWEKGSDSPPRNLLRTMCAFSGIAEVRFAVARKLDAWIQNGKLQRNAMELLLFVATNFGDAASSQHDADGLSLLLKMRSLKSKQVQSVFSVALPAIMNASPENVRVAIRLIITNEFGPSPNRYPMNMSILHTIFQMNAEKTTRVFAEELSAMVVSREEYCKPSRLFTREIIRSFMRSDFNFSLFADGYFQRIWDEAERSELGIEDHVLKSAAEVITMMPMVVCLIPNVREAFSNRRASTASSESLSVIAKFEKDLISHYAVCLRWLPRFKNLVEYDEYRLLYQKILYLESPDYYTAMDQGPNEMEFNHCHKVFGECRLTDSIIWLMVGEQFHTLTQYDVIDVIFSLTKRAVHCKIIADSEWSLICFSSQYPAFKLLERMLRVSLFKTPVPIELPPLYVTSLYSRVWVIIIMWICTGKPGEAVSEVYNIYPVFRLFLHMIMTGDFTFPQSFEDKSVESISWREKELCAAEEETILREEKRMDTMQRGIPSEINKENSVLLKTCSMPFPMDEIRMPSDTFLNDLKMIATECRVAANLCQCRTPDLLHNIIEKYGVEKAIPAIKEFLLTNKGAVDSLPLTVLAEFLLFYLASLDKTLDEEKLSNIITRLKKSTDGDEGSDAIIKLLEGLAHPSLDVRTAAGKALNLILKNSDVLSSAFPLSSVEELKGFKSNVSSVCKYLVNATIYENDKSRSMEYLDFVFKYLDCIAMDATNLHEIASSVALLSEKIGDDAVFAGRLAKIILYYLEPSGSEALNSTRRMQPIWPITGIKYMEEYIVHRKGVEFSVSSGALEAAISLVCRFKSDEWLQVRSEIVKKWIVRDDLSLSVSHSGRYINIFNDTTRGLMLSSSDETIVKEALSTVSGVAALQMLCTFGLTTYAAGELLKSVDQISVGEIERSKIMAAIPFARAYRYKECVAGARFLQSATSMLASEATLKMETEEDEVIPLAPVPQCEPLQISNQLLKKAEVTSLLMELTIPGNGAAFKCSLLVSRSALEDESVSMAVVDHFENNLPFFFENHRAFVALLQLICYCSDKYPAVHERVSSLANRVNKSASVHPSVAGFLKKFVSPNESKTEKKRELISKNLSTMSADSLLETLNKLATVSHIDRTRYLNAFLEKRPEIIDCSKDVNFLERQILAIFSGRNGVESLISQLPLRCSTDALTRVLKKILQSFNPRLNPRLVIDFLLYCTSEVYTPRLSPIQLICLSTYLAELVIREPNEIRIAVSLVDKMVDAAGFDILLPVGNVLVSMERSDLIRDKRERVSQLLRAIQQEFPCLKVSDMANLVTLSGTRWRIKDADKNLTAVLSMLFENSYETAAVSSAIESMHQILSNHPDVLAREFGVFSNLLSKMVTVDQRTARMFNYRAIIALFRDCCERLLPALAGTDLDHVDTAIQLLITIFERNFKGTNNEKTISEMVLYILSYYLENHVSRARELLFDQLTQVEFICKLLPELQCTISIQDNIRLLNSEFS